MKLLQVYDQDGIKLGLVDVSECGTSDKEVGAVLTEAFNTEDAIDREELLEEHGIFQVYIESGINIQLD